MPELYDMPDRYSRVSEAVDPASGGCGCQYDAAGRLFVDHCVCPAGRETASMNLAVAEHVLRGQIVPGQLASTMRQAASLVMAEYDRRGAIEQRARDMSTDTDYASMFRDAARIILGGDR